MLIPCCVTLFMRDFSPPHIDDWLSEYFSRHFNSFMLQAFLQGTIRGQRGAHVLPADISGKKTLSNVPRVLKATVHVDTNSGTSPKMTPLHQIASTHNYQKKYYNFV